MKYYFYNTAQLIYEYENKYRINKGSLMEFNLNLTVASLANMTVNCLDDNLHLLPTKFKFSIPQQKTNKTYAELMDERATELVTYARLNNKTIVTFWSGGIDSTCVLVSLLKQNANDILTVACNASSIYEYRDFFEQYLKNKVKLLFVQDINYTPNANILYVRSSGADTLMGGDLHTLFFYAYRDRITDPPSRDMFGKMINFVTSTMTEYQIDILYDQIITTARQSEINLDTIWDMVVFFDLTHKVAMMYWAQDFPYIFAKDTPKEQIVDIDTWVAKFYMTPTFYSWALYDCTVSDRIGNNLFEYKKVMKDYIFDFNKDTNYYENKTKFSSLGIRSIPSKAKKYFVLDENCNCWHLKDNNLLLEQLHAANERII